MPGSLPGPAIVATGKAAAGSEAMKTRHTIWTGLLAALLLPGPGSLTLAAEVAPAVQEKFTKATALLKENRFAEALPVFQELAQQLPDSPGVLGNLGVVATKLGNHQLALQSRLRYLQLQPGDPAVMSAVMQNYQALGKIAERDAQRERIFKLWESLPAETKAQAKGYVRDDFTAGGTRFIATEFFEPFAPMYRAYRFDALDGEGKVIWFIALESGDSSTKVARELGNIGKSERIWSVDKYQERNHWSYGLMKSRPSYDTVRAMVVSVAEGKLAPMSSSSR